MTTVDTLLFVAAISLILYGIFKYFKNKKSSFDGQNIAYKKSSEMFLPNLKAFLMRYRSNEWVGYLYGLFPNEKIFGGHSFHMPFYFARDPEVVKQLAIKDFDHFEDHRLFLADPDLDSMFGNSLILLRGKKWRDMRATLSPAFTGSKMRQMFELVCECAETISEHFKEKAKRGEQIEPEMKELYQFYTNDVIASAAFGLKINSLENPENQFFRMGKRMMTFSSFKGIMRVMAMLFVPRLMKMFNIELLEPEPKNFFKSMVLDTIDVREKQKILRQDMINIMMRVKRGNGEQLKDQQQEQSDKTVEGFATVEESSIGREVVKREWTDDEIVAQCFLFFFAGFDTSSTALAFTSYELALNEDIQERVYQEILEIKEQLNGKRLSYDVIQKMTYLDMVVSETLRLWPPLMTTDRLCSRDYLYDDGNRKFNIPKGSIVFVPIFAYHRDEKYFPNPTKFDPERFSDENKGNIIPGTYIPFGIGPRNCIGSRFALMEVKAVLYYLLLNFKFVPSENTQIPLKLAKNPAAPILSEQGIKLKLIPRNQQ